MKYIDPVESQLETYDIMKNKRRIRILRNEQDKMKETLKVIFATKSMNFIINRWTLLFYLELEKKDFEKEEGQKIDY